MSNPPDARQEIIDMLLRRDFAQALAMCDATAGVLPAEDTYFLRGLIHLAKGEAPVAVEQMAQAHRAQPGRADIAYHYGTALQQADRLPDAVAVWRQAVTAEHPFKPAWVDLTLGLALLGDTQAALDACRQGLEHYPNDDGLLRHNAHLLHRAGRLQESAAVLESLAARHPGDARIWINRGRVLKDLRRWGEAEECYHHALASPDPAHRARALFNLSSLLLLRGQWYEGFAAYEARLHLPHALSCPWPLPRWEASLPTGSRILLWNEQGLGDAVMFARFAPLLAAKGYRVFACVQKPVKELMASMPGIEAAYDLTEQPPAMDAALPLCSLPFALGLDIIDSCAVPYLNMHKADRRAARVRRVGLVWAGKATHVNDANRSMRLADFTPLFDLPGIEWVAVQTGDKANEIIGLRDLVAIEDLSPSLASLSEAAAAIATLDLLISVDTAAAHVAGAMGQKVWTLLPAIGNDWRWGIEGQTTVWYPSMRLFRQTEPGAWGPVMAEVRRQLAAA